MDKYAELARRVLRRTRHVAAPPLRLDRDRLEASVERALATRARRMRARRRWSTVTVALAACLLAVVGGRALLRRHGAASSAASTRQLAVLSTAPTGDGASPAPQQPVLARGTRLGAPASGEVRIGAPDGTALALEAGGELTVVDNGPRRQFTLERGAVRAHVAKLSPGERFLIDTPDAEVEVHGTRFRVALVSGDPACAAGATTRVSVTEGVVSVRYQGHQTFVPAGQAWPPECAPRSPVAEAAPNAGSVVDGGLMGRATAVAATAGTSTRATGARIKSSKAFATGSGKATALRGRGRERRALTESDLTAQNDLFSAAITARQEGRSREALRLFGRLISDYPRGPLAESATVQRMKLLVRLDQTEAARTAEAYLASYPNGFARSEASRIARAGYAP